MEQLKPATQTFSQLCEAYSVSDVTLRKWLKTAGVYQKGKKIYTPLEVKNIYEKLGEP